MRDINAGAPSCPAGGGGLGAGNPIHVGTGNKYQREVDLESLGPAGLTFVRHYNSRARGTTTGFGNWRHTYARRLVLEPDYRVGTQSVDPELAQNTLQLIRSDGRTLVFYRTGEHGLAASREEIPGWIPAVGTNRYPLEWTGSGWRYRNDAGALEYYDETGQLQRIVNRQGLTQWVEHDAEGRVTEVHDDFGRSLSFAYDTEGRLSRLDAPADQSWHYDHDADGNLTTVTHPDGTTRTYHYGESGAPADYLTGITDENGDRFATWQYDDRGRAILSEHAGGAERTEIEYLSDGRVRVTDAGGGERIHTTETIRGRMLPGSIDEGCSACGTTAEWEYNALGLPTRTVDRNGNVTTYQYNAHGLETSRTEAVGTPAERTVTTDWDTDLRLPLTIEEPGLHTQYTYDSRGRRLSKTETDPATGESRTTAWSYHPDSNGVPGQLATIDGPRTDVDDVTTFEYDTQGNRIRTINALGHVTGITDHDAHGRPFELVDPNGLVTELEYDARGRLVSRDVGGEITTFGYDAAGNLTTIALPDGSALQYEYDAAQRLVALADDEGHRIEYTLDAAGNRIEQNVRADSGPLVRTQQQVFDELNRLVRTVGALGQATEHGYDPNGNRIATTDPAGDATQRAFDALDRLTQVTDPLGGITTYGYDASDRITEVTDPNGNTTRYSYNGFGDRTEIDSPDSGVTTYEHDAAGNVIETTDAKGQTTEYTYDALNRLVRAEYADGATVDYARDEGANGIGRLARIDETGPDGRTHATAWAYDARGRVLERTQTADGISLTTTHAYDSAGRRTETVYPSGRVVTYTHDTDELTGLAVDGETVITGADYQPFGPVAGWTWGDDDAHTRQYDLDGRLTEHGLATGSPGGGTRRLDYTVDDNIATITGPRLARNYGYDGLDRLIAANDPDRTDQYTYDANGNRTGRTKGTESETYTIDTGSNRLLAVSGAREVDYTHDANGNRIDDGEHSYGYSARNRLTKVDGGDTARYRYNALGQRIHKQTGQSVDYLALAEAAEAEADSLAQEAAALRDEARQAEQDAAAARQRAADARAERERARAERDQAEAEAAQHRQTAATAQARADAFAARAERWRDRIVEPPGNLWQRLSNAAYRALAGLFEQLAAHFADRARDRLARAEAADERATAAQAAIDAAESRRAEAQQAAEQAAQRAEARHAEADTKQRQAAERRNQAAEYRRLAEENPQTRTDEYFVYNRQGHLIGRYDDNGNPIREYIRFGNIPVAVAANDGLYYIHSDHLGTPRAVSQPNGAVVWSWISDAFGDSAPNEDPDGDGETFALNLSFAGQYFDAETRLHQNWWRSYSPTVGRYITADPIGIDGGLNAYSYAKSSPTNLIDPMGLVPAGLVSWMTEGLAQSFTSATYEGGRGLQAGIECAKTFCDRGSAPLTREQARAECILNLDMSDSLFSSGVMFNCTDVCMGLTSHPKFKKSCQDDQACIENDSASKAS